MENMADVFVFFLCLSWEKRRDGALIQATTASSILPTLPLTRLTWR
jgi:hypothetical protein